MQMPERQEHPDGEESPGEEARHAARGEQRNHETAKQDAPLTAQQGVLDQVSPPYRCRQEEMQFGFAQLKRRLAERPQPPQRQGNQ